MIRVEQDKKDPQYMKVDLHGNAEQIAQEYVALTLKLLDNYPIILDRAQWYLDDIKSLRIMREDK